MLVVEIDDEWLAQNEEKKPDAAPESVRRLIAVAIGWLLASVAVAVVFAAVTAAIYALNHVKTTPDLQRFYGAMAMLGFSIALLIASVMRARVVGYGSIRVGLGNEPISRLSAVTVMFLAAVAYAALLNLDVISARPEVITKFNSVGPWLTTFAMLFIVLLLGFLGPFSEELFFRGWLWTGLRRHWGVLPTASLTSVTWLAVHLEQGILKPALLVPVAVLLAASRHFGGSVRAPIALHTIYNLVTISPTILRLTVASYT